MNRRIFCVLLVIAIVLTLSACGQSSQSRSGPAGSAPAAAESAAPEETASPAPSTGEGTADGGAGPQEGAPQSDILIAYFSWSASGNTEKMAAFIREQTGGDLLKIGPSVPYPTDYDECTEPERDGNQRPAIANLPDSLSGYDTIFIGYPIWWHTAPMIIGAFLENYDLTGVEAYPFTQSASMDKEQFENSMDFVRESAGGASVHDGLFVRAGDTEGIRGYLEENGFGAREGEENVEYRYQTRELRARRDGNSIYGEIYVPQDAGDHARRDLLPRLCRQLPGGRPYAQALAAKGYVVYCFDFCGGGPGEGAGHGFSGSDAQRAIDLTLEYLDEHKK